MSNRSPDERIGSLFANRYELEALLGEGAMGAVYRARHARIGRMFAIKVLHPRLSTPKVIQRFEREAELAGRLQHPNVVAVVDLSTTETGELYLVMDFVDGEPLVDLLRDAPMPTERVLWLARQLCEGLDHAHSFGLVHRDFKPENVIVARDAYGFEQPRIVDFGVAILREDMRGDTGSSRLTTDGMVVGTPHYMSPEQVRGEAIDARSDLFALGLIMYELMTGKLPFDGDGVAVAHANLLDQAPRMRARTPTAEIDPVLEAVVEKLLQKQAALRPQSAREVRELLDLVERDRPAAMRALGMTPPAAASEIEPARIVEAPPTPVEARRELHTGRRPRRELDTGRRPLAIMLSWRQLAIAAAVLLMLLLVVRLATHRSEAPRVVASTPSVVTVPVPMPVPAVPPGPVQPGPVQPVPTPPAPVQPGPVQPAPAPSPAHVPAQRSPATPLVAKPPPTAAELTAQYRAVGQLLRQRDAVDATDALWTRYRRLRLDECLRGGDQRVECAQVLDRIASDAHGK